MTVALTPAPAVVPGAGGLVWRDSPEGGRLAVVHRRAYDDWTLPKGKVEAHETWREAAVREVREETGCAAIPTSLGGVSCHHTGAAPKIVMFWNMRLEHEAPVVARDEVDAIEWLLPADAVSKLTHPQEKLMVTRNIPGAIEAPRRNWLSELWRDKGFRRLRGTLAPYRLELAQRIADAGPQSDLGWAYAAISHLDDAQRFYDADELDAAWRSFHAAHRAQLGGLDDGERMLAADALRLESDAKLSGWRRKAVARALDADKGSVTAAQLRHAAFLRDERAGNDYHQMLLLKDHLKVLLAVLFGSVLAVGALATWYPLELDAAPQVLDGRLFLAVALFGLMGASFSAILSLAQASAGRRIPEVVQHSFVATMRPILGAATALAALVLLRGGLLNLGDLRVGGVLAIAFAAGFTERLVVRAITVVAGDEPAATTTPAKKDGN